MAVTGEIWSYIGGTVVNGNVKTYVATFHIDAQPWASIAVGWTASSGASTASVTAVEVLTDGSNKIKITLNSFYVHTGADISYTFTAPPPAPPSSGVACFVAGTRVLTANGYKAIETLTLSDRIMTSEGREVAAKVYFFELPTTTKTSAPYRIEAGAFGRNLPAAPISLSPIHKIQVRPHLWTSPHDAAAAGNSRVKQYGVGEPIRYYHIECENYLRDNLVTEGLVVESLGHEGRYKGVKVYTWSKRFQGYTRISADSKFINK